MQFEHRRGLMRHLAKTKDLAVSGGPGKGDPTHPMLRIALDHHWSRKTEKPEQKNCVDTTILRNNNAQTPEHKNIHFFVFAWGIVGVSPR